MYDVRRLRLLRELAARGTVTAVAEALAYTPSAVSQQLAQLERDAGVALTERAGRGVRLTEAGRRLAGHADAVIARLEAAEADLAALSGHATGRLRIAVFQTAAVALVLPALEGLLTTYPDVRAEVIEVEAEESLPGLRLGDFDLVVAEEYEHAPRRRDAAVERAELCRDRMLVALPQRHPLAGQERIELAELAGEAWVTAREGTAFGAMLVRACRARGAFEPEILHRTNDLRLLSEIVARGLAVGLMPSLGLFWIVDGVVVRPLEGPPLDRRIFTCVRGGTGARPALRALDAALARRVAELGLG